MSTENIAYEKRYQDWRAQYDTLFVPENRNGDLHLNGNENEPLDKESEVRYTWGNLDTDAEFWSMFRHSNGNHYLIFRTELYGYSVLEVESGQA